MFLGYAWAQCYSVDGSPATGGEAEPCDPSAAFSGCCDLNKAHPDICLSTGLCYAQEPGYEGFIYYNGCTDKTGVASACPHFCPDSTGSPSFLRRARGSRPVL